MELLYNTFDLLTPIITTRTLDPHWEPPTSGLVPDLNYAWKITITTQTNRFSKRNPNEENTYSKENGFLKKGGVVWKDDKNFPSLNC